MAGMMRVAKDGDAAAWAVAEREREREKRRETASLPHENAEAVVFYSCVLYYNNVQHCTHEAEHHWCLGYAALSAADLHGVQKKRILTFL